jgi:phosphoribosylglycinamide formyltransferase-1
VHPSLLPEFPGKDAIGQALRAGARVTGVTVHLVDEGIDTGPALAQAQVRILPGDTADSLAARIHAVEHRLYPAVVREVIERGWSGGR